MKELFDEELRGVAFPDIDASVLDGAVEDMREKARVLEQQRAALEAAKNDLDAAEQGFDRRPRERWPTPRSTLKATTAC